MNIREGFWFLLGMLVGIFIIIFALYVYASGFIHQILPYIQIDNINFDVNETALVEAVNKTFKAVGA